MSGNEILTAQEAAALLKISRKTLYRLATRGVVRGNKVGKVWRFRRADLIEYVTARPDPAGGVLGGHLNAPRGG